jgi:hypothetical protein
MAGYIKDPRNGGTLYVADNGDIFAPYQTSSGLMGMGAINWGKIGNFFKDTVAPVLLPAVAAKIAGNGGQQGGSSGPPVVAVQTPFGGAGLGIDPSLLLIGGGVLLVMMMRK